jgi:transcriptional regulator with XRE-family HTH domain
MKLGEKIKLVRKQRGMTQRELGERLHLDGNVNRFPLLNPVTPV